MELLGGAHLDVPEDSYKLVPLRDDLLLLNGPHYVNIIKLGDTVLSSHQFTDDTNKRNIFRYLPASNKILHVGKDNTVKTLSPTSQGIFVLGDALNDSTVRISLQESIYLLETLQDSDLNWGPDTEDISQRVAFQLQQLIPELQLLPQKKQPWLECNLGPYSDLEPLLEDIASQHISDQEQNATINKMLQRLRYNAGHHLKHPSSSPVVSVSISPTEEVAVTGSTDGNIAIWDISKTTPRLVNTISGLDGLLEVLLGEVLVAVHQPNVVIVHQIGEHALSEILFQKTLDGTVLIGATYVPTTQKVVLALNVISSPSRANYFLQTASVNLDDRSLDLGDRARVEGSFTALAKTSKSYTVSITQDGALALFDSLTTETTTFKKPQSNYRFTDVTCANGHVYATTLAGAILSFNLSNIPRPTTPLNISPSKVAAVSDTTAFSNFAAPQSGNDGFGDFSVPVGGHDDSDTTAFSDFVAPQSGDDGFGDFSSPQGVTNDEFDDFATPPNNASHDTGFNTFATPSSPPAVHNTPALRNGTPLPEDDYLDELGFGTSSSSFSPIPATSSVPRSALSPKFTLEDRPGAAIAGSVATHNSSTGDFGELPSHTSLVDAGSVHDSPVLGSKLRQSSDFQESPYSFDSSPSLQRRDSPVVPPTTELGDFGAFSKSSPPMGHKSPKPFAQDLTASPGKSPHERRRSTFGDLQDTQDHFGGSFGSNEQFGNFGDQGQDGDFGAIPPPSQSNGLSSSTNHVAQSQKDVHPTPELPKGDFGDFNDLSAPTFEQANNFGGFEESPQQQNIGNFGEFGVTDSTAQPSSSPLPLTPPNLRSSTHATSPSTSLHSSNFRVSSSVLPASPSIFSQDFGFDAPPPASLSQSGVHAPAPIRQSSGGFDAFDDDFGVPATQASPKPQHNFGSPVTPKRDSQLGDFGELSAASPHAEKTDEFEFDSFSAAPAPQEFGNATTSPKFNAGFSDFGETSTAAAQAGDFGELSPAPHTIDFDEFGGNSAAPHAGDFGETSSPQTSGFDDFGESSHADAFGGDFGESPVPSQADAFGDFGESVVPHASESDDGEFGEFPAKSSNYVAQPTAKTGDFDDFGSFDAPASEDQKGDDDDGFGDFGDFSKPQDNDDTFGDFGGFASGGTADQAEFGFGDSDTFETATPVATAPPPAPVEPTPPPPPSVPQVPSIFTQDAAQLKTTLNETFSTAFSTLIPSTLQTTPHPSTLPSDLDLEASLKGNDKSPTSARHTPKCTHCGVLLRTPDAPSCLACGAPAQGASQFTPWSGVVLPPIAEIKFWDALGVPMRQMTEKMKDTQPAFSSSSGILTPVASNMGTLQPSTLATHQTLSSSWDFNDNPFAPKATPASVPTSTAPATSASAAQPAQRVATNAQQVPAQGFAGAFEFPSSSTQPSSSISSSSGSTRPPAPSTSSPSLSSTPAPPRNSADDDFFLSFSTSTSAPPKPHAILSSTSTYSPPAQPWSQFLARIPDLSFVIADRLVIPSIN